MRIPEEIYCPECKLHSCPEIKELPDRVKIICFWCDNEVRTIKKLRFVFGKYKGQIIEECKDLNYLVWLQDNFKVLTKEHRKMMDEVKDRIEEL